jgi:hypothetical protein
LIIGYRSLCYSVFKPSSGITPDRLIATGRACGTRSHYYCTRARDFSRVVEFFGTALSAQGAPAT